VLVHGDVHQWNALQAGEGHKLVDRDGLVAEPEYDLGIIMREDPLELLEEDAMARAGRLAARTGLDAVAIWEWGVVERVSTGLLGTKVGLQPVVGQMRVAHPRRPPPSPTPVAEPEDDGPDRSSRFPRHLPADPEHDRVGPWMPP